MATREQIADLINDCWAYFKTNSPPIKTIESWASELLNVDLWNSGEFIKRKFKSFDEFPKNFPKAVMGIYREWLMTQPREIGGDKGCPLGLIGEGLIHACKVEHGYKYHYVFRCGKCKTSNTPYPERTGQQLIDNGYDLDWQHASQDKVINRKGVS